MSCARNTKNNWDTLGYTEIFRGMQWIQRCCGRLHRVLEVCLCVYVCRAGVSVWLLIFGHYRCASTQVEAQTTAPVEHQKHGKKFGPLAVGLEEVRWASSNATVEAQYHCIVPISSRIS